LLFTRTVEVSNLGLGPGAEGYLGDNYERENTVSAMTLVAPRGVGSLYGATLEVPTAVPRGECSNFVDLARRMNITPDDAIRQFMDLSRRHPVGRSRRT
jgi:hypothetical protein